MATELKFHYPRKHFLIRAINLLFILVLFFAFTLTLSGLGWLWPSVFFVLFAIAIFFTTISPLMTAHGVDESGITIRQGLLFKARFGYQEIESVEKQTSPMWKMGIPSSRARGRITVASGNEGLVRISLKEPKRFSSLLFRTGSELVIDVISHDRFVELVNERMNKLH